MLLVEFQRGNSGEYYQFKDNIIHFNVHSSIQLPILILLLLHKANLTSLYGKHLLKEIFYSIYTNKT